jgi:arylsulfate sulfotransferase
MVKSRWCIVVLLLSTVSLITSCSPDSSFTTPPTITPSSAVVLPGQTVQFTVVAGGNNPQWLVNGIAQGSSSMGTITSAGLYTAPTAIDPTAANTAIRVSVEVNGVRSYSSPVLLYGQLTPGTVSSTANPLVASYSIVAPEGASVCVQFGPDTNYGFTTWLEPAPPSGGVVRLLVAGMRASSAYHMRAVIQLADGTRIMGVDHVFTTGPLPADRLPTITVTQVGGMTPASGIELLSLINLGSGNQLTTVATDLFGHIIWYYDVGQGSFAFPIKPLPNGHMLVVVAGTTNEIREIDLAGTVINRISLNDLNSGLTQIGSSLQAVGGSVLGSSFHHDILQLPNAHLILLVSVSQSFSNVGNPPGTPVIGDALVDWDPQRRAPVWTWSTFDHLDINHAPFGYPDWTHSNSVRYSPDDGNLILSMRNQNLIVKINYRDGAGDGRVLWRLGPGGDFALPSGESPIEWNYGQHYLSLLGPSTAGIYSLMFFNNGNNRLVDQSDTVCGSPGSLSCYSSVPVVQLNEYTNTAQILSEDKLSAYSICCGNASWLSNGNLEFDVAADQTSSGSYIQEVTPGPSPELVWQMNIGAGQLAYQGYRIPSLYPGIQW